MYGIGLITSRLWIGDPKFENSPIPVVIAYKTTEVPFFWLIYFIKSFFDMFLKVFCISSFFSIKLVAFVLLYACFGSVTRS